MSPPTPRGKYVGRITTKKKDLEAQYSVTIAKGVNADYKFIERAINDERQNIIKIIEMNTESKI